MVRSLSQPRPYLLIALTGALLAQAAAAQEAVNPYRSVLMNAPSSYWGYSFNPYGGYLHGVAAVTRSQGQWLIYQQEAIAMKEKNRQEKINTRRKELEHWAWEREFITDSWERERKRSRDIEIERSRTDPPLTEIVAGTSLNLLLAELKKDPNLSQGLSVRVEAEWLPHIHVTFVMSGAGGNIGLLKGDHLSWPLFLRREEFTPQRERFNRLIAQAKKETLQGAAKADTIIDGRRQIDDLEQRISQQSRANRNELWSPSDYIGAARALREFRAALQMLEREDAAFYLAPLQGHNVVELVQLMKAKGLSFAPATNGDERFYVALHRALAHELTQTRSTK